MRAFRFNLAGFGVSLGGLRKNGTGYEARRFHDGIPLFCHKLFGGKTIWSLVRGWS
jgi:hypothetical protein